MDTLEHLDEFESVFRRAEQEQFVYTEKKIDHVLLILEERQTQTDSTIDALKQFSDTLSKVEKWETLQVGPGTTVQNLEEKVKKSTADLLITWRHLHEKEVVARCSLGTYVDMLTQATDFPILLLPGSAASPATIQGRKCDTVLAATDHLAGDHRLVNFAAAMANRNGKLVLCHVEDDLIMQRYIQAIERIPELNTELVKSKLQQQLNRDVVRYLQAARESMEKAGVPVQIETELTAGHRLSTYKELIVSHKADLLVMNTKDEEQLAMHGLAYAMSIEFIELPQLLL